MEKWKTGIFVFFIFWYICGVILVGFDLLPSWLEWSNSVFIITSGILAWIFMTERFGNLKGTIISLVIFITTFMIEYFGSSLSFLFGNYTYTNQFAPNVIGVPIAIGFAWVMVIATGYALLDYLSIHHAFLRALFGGVFALLMDLVLDPVAYVAKEYWIWHEAGNYYDIPWTNFLGWFIIAFFIHLVLSFIKTAHTSFLWQSRIIVLYCLIIAMFALIAVMNHLYLAAAIGFMTSIVLYVIVFGRKGAKA